VAVNYIFFASRDVMLTSAWLSFDE